MPNRKAKDKKMWKIVLLLCGSIIIGQNGFTKDEERNIHEFKQYKEDIVPESEYKTLDDTTQNQQVLNMCVWTADMAQAVQIGRRVHGEYDRIDSKQIVSNILHNDKTNPILTRQILKIFDIVWTEYTSEVSSTRVFVDQYNKCVRKAKKLLLDKENFM